ncbi:MAG: aminobenzoyl-glutamate transporter [Bacteroidetes bacterium GWF2_33_16]|nr:MAG: aminobenzoyl-glutamate transporter [Bacteroidetes bacterium GWE2_32_14]OFY02249.1 MAG: aminobenzoyl-glutamate transporter [Bacteroidetes bacterium GWF2_33_16]
MNKQNKISFSTRFFKGVEKAGNALPHPAALFGIFAILVLVISWIGFKLDWIGIHPSTGESIHIVNLLSKQGLHRILLEMVDNYTGFAPLGIVMVALLGIGVAESSGLMKAAINALVLKAPKSMITFIIVLSGILSNTASDLGYILIIPLAGIIFHSIGRHPIAGMSAAFAGVSGGFSANLLIGTIDPLLAGLSTEAAKIINPDYYVLPTANYYFMAVSTIIIAFAGTWVTTYWIEPRLGKYIGDVKEDEIEYLKANEKKGLKWVLFIILIWLSLFLWGLIPDNGFLRGADNTILHTPLLKGFISVLFLMATSCGIVYGYIVGKFKKHSDVFDGMVSSFKSLVAFLVLVFFAAQFVAWFKWSNLGIIIAIKGAVWLQQINLGIIPLLILFILFSGLINLFMGSASAKWAILAPVLVPMFMLLGYSPELSQAVFRIGDSITNVISPMMSFFALIIVYYQKYDKNAGIGTIMSTMLPYSFVFFVLWTLLLIVWVLLGIPLGPDSGLFYSQ